MTADLDREIAELLGPPEIKCDDKVRPLPFSTSIDASMAVIAKRWPGACVELSVASAASPFALARIRASTTGPILGDATQVTQHSKENGGQVEPHPTADALALALLSALRAQPEQAK